MGHEPFPPLPYGHDITKITDHSAVKAVLNNPGVSGKHARQQTKVFGAGIRKVNIIYRADKENTNADALSRQPHLPAPVVGTVEEDVQVLSVNTCDCEDRIDIDISRLFNVS